MFGIFELLTGKKFPLGRRSPFPPGPCEPDLPRDPEPVKPPAPVCKPEPGLRIPVKKRKRKR